jgi:hypothetical protein
MSLLGVVRCKKPPNFKMLRLQQHMDKERYYVYFPVLYML